MWVANQRFQIHSDGSFDTWNAAVTEKNFHVNENGSIQADGYCTIDGQFKCSAEKFQVNIDGDVFLLDLLDIDHKPFFLDRTGKTYVSDELVVRNWDTDHWVNQFEVKDGGYIYATGNLYLGDIETETYNIHTGANGAAFFASDLFQIHGDGSFDTWDPTLTYKPFAVGDTGNTYVGGNLSVRERVGAAWRTRAQILNEGDFKAYDSSEDLKFWVNSSTGSFFSNQTGSSPNEYAFYFDAGNKYLYLGEGEGVGPNDCETFLSGKSYVASQFSSSVYFWEDIYVEGTIHEGSSAAPKALTRSGLPVCATFKGGVKVGGGVDIDSDLAVKGVVQYDKEIIYSIENELITFDSDIKLDKSYSLYALLNDVTMTLPEGIHEGQVKNIQIKRKDSDKKHTLTVYTDHGDGFKKVSLKKGGNLKLVWSAAAWTIINTDGSIDNNA
jgi:hypothetical protein